MYALTLLWKKSRKEKERRNLKKDQISSIYYLNNLLSIHSSIAIYHNNAGIYCTISFTTNITVVIIIFISQIKIFLKKKKRKKENRTRKRRKEKEKIGVGRSALRSLRKYKEILSWSPAPRASHKGSEKTIPILHSLTWENKHGPPLDSATLTPLLSSFDRAQSWQQGPAQPRQNKLDARERLGTEPPQMPRFAASAAVISTAASAMSSAADISITAVFCYRTLHAPRSHEHRRVSAVRRTWPKYEWCLNFFRV